MQTAALHEPVLADRFLQFPVDDCSFGPRGIRLGFVAGAPEGMVVPMSANSFFHYPHPEMELDNFL